MGDQTDLDVMDGDGDLDGGSDAGESASAPQSSAGADQPKDSKRVADLMSKWQRAEARATKAEEALKARTTEGDAGEASGESAISAELREWRRERVFAKFPKLADAGLSPDVLAGDSETSITASAKSLVELLEGFETTVRNKVLSEHGLEPASTGQTGPQYPNFAEMSSEEFAKWRAEHRS